MSAAAPVRMVLAALLLCAALTGCTSPPKSFSGFMESYAGFVPDPTFSGALIYRSDPDLDLTSYRALLVDPVVVHFGAESHVAGTDPAEVRALADHFRAAILRAFEGRYPLEERASEGVLRLRGAITDAVPASPGGNLLGALLPPLTLYSFANKAVTGTHPFAGGASIELEVRDAATDERLAALVDRRSGGRFELISGATRWGQARAALDFWASELPARLDMQRARRELRSSP